MTREAERVRTGSWYEYFKETYGTVEMSEKSLGEYEKLVRDLWGDFFEKHLSFSGGPLLDLGAGFGICEIPLARRGYKIIGIDNDKKVIEVLKANVRKYARDNFKVEYADLYGDFHLNYLKQGIQACISFGVLEHFTEKDLPALIKKQFLIAPLMIFMVPINTSETLAFFGATGNPEGHIDKNGIYRNFWTAERWEKQVLAGYNIIDKHFEVQYRGNDHKVHMVTFVVRKW